MRIERESVWLFVWVIYTRYVFITYFIYYVRTLTWQCVHDTLLSGKDQSNIKFNPVNKKVFTIWFQCITQAKLHI